MTECIVLEPADYYRLESVCVKAELAAVKAQAIISEAKAARAVQQALFSEIAAKYPGVSLDTNYSFREADHALVALNPETKP